VTKIGPSIPFADHDEFKRFARKTEAEGDPILSKIQMRISGPSGKKRRMPLSFRDLTPFEQQCLLDYLRAP
jgi:hypothetical protein